MMENGKMISQTERESYIENKTRVLLMEVLRMFCIHTKNGQGRSQTDTMTENL